MISSKILLRSRLFSLAMRLASGHWLMHKDLLGQLSQGTYSFPSHGTRFAFIDIAAAPSSPGTFLARASGCRSGRFVAAVSVCYP